MEQTTRWQGVETRGNYMTSQGEQCSELFCVFLELHERGGDEDEQARALPCFVFC